MLNKFFPAWMDKQIYNHMAKEPNTPLKYRLSYDDLFNGYMGSGKTTLGKQLAQHLKYEFIDLDHYIEENNHKAISEIFRDEGEDHFREIEYAYLKTF